jgi:hypothetical protein
VQKINETYIKDSLDYLALANISSLHSDNEDRRFVTLIGLERKAHLAPGIDQHDRELATRAMLQIKHQVGPSKKYFVVDANDVNLCEMIPRQHEAIQILHHAYTYSLQYIMIVVGDNNGELIYCVAVRFTPELRNSYGKVMKVIKDLPYAGHTMTEMKNGIATLA